LNGRIIPIGKLIEQRARLLSTKTIEEVKKIAPWFKQKEINQKIKEVPTNKLPKGIGLPPYHDFCRTTTVISYALETESYITTE